MQYHWISININYTILGFSGSSVGKERICPWYRRPQFSSWVGKIPWRRARLPTPVFWPREFHGLYSPWGLKESDTTERLHFTSPTLIFLGFPCGSAGKESACNLGDLGSIPGLGRSPGERNSYLLQYSGQENSIDCIVRGVAKCQTWLSDFHFHAILIRQVKVLSTSFN